MIEAQYIYTAVCYGEGSTGFEGFEATSVLEQVISGGREIGDLNYVSHWRNIGASFDGIDGTGVVVLEGPSCSFDKVLAHGPAPWSETSNVDGSRTVSGRFDNVDIRDMIGNSLLIFDGTADGITEIACCEIEAEVWK